MAEKKAPGPRLMTLQQISSESGVPYTSVRDMALRGYLKRVQLGDSRRWWVTRDEYERAFFRQA